MRTSIVSIKSGFTLAELLIGLTISSFILTSAYAAIMSLAKGTESLVNYTEMNNDSRYALEIFARDARAAKDVHDWTSSKCSLKRKVWNSGTSSYDFRFIVYNYNANAGTLERSVHAVDSDGEPGTQLETRTLLYDVDDLNFVYYRTYDPEIANFVPQARSIPEIKHVQLEALLTRNVLSMKNTNYIISARFMMRNKYVYE